MTVRPLSVELAPAAVVLYLGPEVVRLMSAECQNTDVRWVLWRRDWIRILEG